MPKLAAQIKMVFVLSCPPFSRIKLKCSPFKRISTQPQGLRFLAFPISSRFAAHFIPLSDTLLLDAYAWTMEHEASDVKRPLLEDYGDALVVAVAAG